MTDSGHRSGVLRWSTDRIVRGLGRSPVGRVPPVGAIHKCPSLSACFISMFQNSHCSLPMAKAGPGVIPRFRVIFSKPLELADGRATLVPRRRDTARDLRIPAGRYWSGLLPQ